MDLIYDAEGNRRREKEKEREGWSIGLSENQVERINSSERCIILHIDYKGHNTILVDFFL